MLLCMPNLTSTSWFRHSLYKRFYIATNPGRNTIVLCMTWPIKRDCICLMCESAHRTVDFSGSKPKNIVSNG
jgi:hypothetical protein